MCLYLCNVYELDVCYNKDNLLYVVNDEYLVKHNVPPEYDEEKRACAAPRSVKSNFTIEKKVTLKEKSDMKD